MPLPPPALALYAAALVTGALYLRIVISGSDGPRLPLKVVTTLLMGGALAFAGQTTPAVVAVGLGIVLSAAGDGFLVDSERFFLHGLVAFLLAHVAYVVAFWSPDADLRLGAAIGVAAGAFVAVLWPGLGKMAGPVLVYLTAIAAMVWMAWSTSLVAGVGATSFMVSDAILGFDRFKARVPHRDLAVMLPYWGGQAIIVASVM